MGKKRAKRAARLQAEEMLRLGGGGDGRPARNLDREFRHMWVEGIEQYSIPVDDRFTFADRVRDMKAMQGLVAGSVWNRILEAEEIDLKAIPNDRLDVVANGLYKGWCIFSLDRTRSIIVNPNESDFVFRIGFNRELMGNQKPRTTILFP